MPLDQTSVGRVMSEQMEAIERDHGEDPEAQIGGVITLVEVIKTQGQDRYASNVRIRTNVGDPYRVLGMIRAAEQNIVQGFGTVAEE